MGVTTYCGYRWRLNQRTSPGEKPLPLSPQEKMLWFFLLIVELFFVGWATTLILRCGESPAVKVALLLGVLFVPFFAPLLVFLVRDCRTVRSDSSPPSGEGTYLY